MSLNTPAVAHSVLFNLPRELRDNVYEHLLLQQRPGVGRYGDICLLPSLVFACKQLREKVFDAAASDLVIPTHFEIGNVSWLDEDDQEILANCSIAFDDRMDDEEMLVHYEVFCDNTRDYLYRDCLAADQDDLERFALKFRRLIKTKFLVVEISLSYDDPAATILPEDRVDVWSDLLHAVEEVIQQLPSMLEFSIRIDGACGIWMRRDSVEQA